MMKDVLYILINYYNNKDKVSTLYNYGPLTRIGIPGSEKGGIDEKFTLIPKDNSGFLISDSVNSIILQNQDKFDFLFYWNDEEQFILFNGYLAISVSLQQVNKQFESEDLDERIFINNLKRASYKAILEDYLFNNTAYFIDLVEKGYSPYSLAEELIYNDSRKTEDLILSNYNNIFERIDKIISVTLNDDHVKMISDIEISFVPQKINKTH